MQPLDRLFATHSYPWDALLPSAVWLALCAAALAGLAALLRWRGHPAPAGAVRLALAFGLADMALWVSLFLARSLNEGVPVPWLGFVSVPYAFAHDAIDKLLWYAVGVSAAISPEQLFRGYSHWDGTRPVLFAALLNEAAFVALAAGAAICAAWRSPRR